MECLWLIIGLITFIMLVSIFSNLNQLRKETKTIMGNQADFDAKIASADTKLDSLSEQIAAEGQQVRDFIAANPSVDTSALDSVVSRLDDLGGGIGSIFEPAADEPDEPADNDTGGDDGTPR